MELIIYLAIGAIAGFTAGLFGVGGGLIIVPILFVVFSQMSYDPNVICVLYSSDAAVEMHFVE